MGTLKSRRKEKTKFFSNILNLMKDNSFLDCTIVTQEGITIDVHKVMLLQSPILSRLISSLSCCNGVCGHQDPITLVFPDVPYKHMELLINYFYTGVLNIPDLNDRDQIHDLLIKMLKFPSTRVTKVGHVKCPECSVAVASRDLGKHLIEDHIKVACIRDMRSVKNGDSKPVYCSFHKFTNPNHFCDVDTNLQNINNGIFNYIGKEDPLETVISHYKVHFDHVILFIKENYPSVAVDNEDLFEAERWKLTASTDCDLVPDSGDSDIVLEDSNDDTENVLERDPVIEDSIDDTETERLPVVGSQSSPSHSGGLSSGQEDDENEERNSDDEDVDVDNLISANDVYNFHPSPRAPQPNDGIFIKKSSLKKQFTNVKRLGNRRRHSSSSNRRCKTCKSKFTSKTFPKHLVTHLYDWWSEVGPLDCICPVRECGTSTNSRKYLIQHLATVHKQLDMKLEERGQTLSDYDMEDDNDDNGDVATGVDEGNDVIENTNENEPPANNPPSTEAVTDDSVDNLLKESSQDSRSNLRMEAENETDNNVNNGLEDSNDVDMLEDGAESDATQPYEKEDEEERMNDFEDVDETVGD